MTDPKLLPEQVHELRFWANLDRQKADVLLQTAIRNYLRARRVTDRESAAAYAERVK
jgi:hypothetical protein